MTLLAWTRTDEHRGHSMARVEEVAGGWVFLGSEVIAGPEEILSCSFRVLLDRDWRTREVEVRSVSALGERSLALRADEQRRWWRNGTPDAALDGCVDVDVAATPLTNTFPIRRLAELGAGDAVTTPVAWVDVPALGVTRVDQTYRRLGTHRWRYSDPLHGAFVLTVDDDGLVTDYEGFATRVG